MERGRERKKDKMREEERETERETERERERKKDKMREEGRKMKIEREEEEKNERGRLRVGWYKTKLFCFLLIVIFQWFGIKPFLHFVIYFLPGKYCYSGKLKYLWVVFLHFFSFLFLSKVISR